MTLKRKHGTSLYREALSRHDELFARIVREASVVLKDTGDGFMARFGAVSDAVNAALRFQCALAKEPAGVCRLRVRAGIHVGEIEEAGQESSGEMKIVGMAADMAARLMGLAQGGQILLTRSVFNNAREFVRQHPDPGDAPAPALRWVAHGRYLLKGLDEPVEVFEVGGEGIAPLTRPPDSEKACRCVTADEEPMMGWRPGVSGEIPGRPGWFLERKLGEGGFGEVWLGVHRRLSHTRVFKFCFDARKLRSFKREMTLFRLLREALGEREDIARLYDVRLDEPPFLLESEYTSGGDLADWAAAQGGIVEVPIEVRLQLVADVADAVAAAHSVGVLHKDIKPSNILIQMRGGRPRPRLADFGIGMLADASALTDSQVTMTGFTQCTDSAGTQAGTRMYAPPELLEGRPFTIQGDVYSLGVLLYQMTIANLERPLAQGWERYVDDPLLREDIGMCVDGDPSRRFHGAGELARRVRCLEQRRRERLEEQRAKVEVEAAHRREAEAQREAELARAAEARSRTLLAQIYVRDGLAWVEKGDWSLALLLFVHALIQESSDPAAQRNHRVRIRQALARVPRLRLAPHGAGLPSAAWRDRTAEYELVPLGSTAGIVARPPAEPTLESAVTSGSRIPTAELEMTIVDHEGWINTICFSPNGRFLATAGEDGCVRIWSTYDGQPVGAAMEHEAPVRRVAFSPDSNRVVSISDDRLARVWDAAGGQPLTPPISLGSAGFDAEFTPDGTAVVTVSNGDVIGLWDAQTGGARSAPMWLPHGVRRAGGVVGEEVIRVMFESGPAVDRAVALEPAPVATFACGKPVECVALSPDGRRVLAATEGNAVTVWDVASRQPAMPPLTHDAPVRFAAFDPSGERIVSAGMDDCAKLWQSNHGQACTRILKHRDGVGHAAFSPSGLLVATAGMDDSARIWDVSTGFPVSEPLRHEDAVEFVRFSPDGSVLASVGSDERVMLWDVKTGRPIGQPLPHRDSLLHRVEFSPCGRNLLLASGEKTVVLWELATGKALSSFEHEAPVSSMTMAPDGCRLATASADGTVRIWNSRTAKPLTPPMCHTARVNAVAFSRDGARLLACTEDGHLIVWNAITGRSLAPPILHADAVTDAVFCPLGEYVAAGCHDGNVYLWSFAPDPRPAEQLLHLAEVLSAHSVDVTGALAPWRLPEWRQRLAEVQSVLGLDLGAWLV